MSSQLSNPLDVASYRTLKTLIEHDQEPCVSLFMPTVKAGPEVRQNQIRFRNLIGDAKEKTAEAFPELDEKTPFRPAMTLLEDDDFWQHQESGLAVFFSPDLFATVRCPKSFSEQTFVAHRFLIKPLLPLVLGDGSFYILALSRNLVRLLGATRHTVQELELPDDVPSGLQEITAVYDPEKQLQWHGRQPAGPQSSESTFHGHGLGERNESELLNQYCRGIDEGLRSDWAPDKPLLVLACVDELFATYRDATGYTNLCDQPIEGNHESTGAQELHELAWPMVRPHFEKQRAEAKAAFLQAAGASLASTDLRQVVPAAAEGRVDALFIATDAEAAGRYVEDRHEVETPGSQKIDSDLVDEAARRALTTGAKLFPCLQADMPNPSAVVNAVFRY